MKKLILFNLLTILFGCSKEEDTKDKNGIIISKEPRWSISKTDDDSLSDNYFLRNAVIYNQSVLIQTRKNREKVIKMIDITNGTVKWEWRDWIEKNVFSGNVFPYIKNNKLTFQSDYENYQINLDDGKTVWKNSFIENYNHWCSGLGDIFLSEHLYNRGIAPEKGGGSVVVMSNLDGKPMQKIKPKYDTEKLSFDDYGWAYTAYGNPFVKNNDTLILVTFNDPPATLPRTYIEWISLYNLTNQKWIYERQKIKNNDQNFGTPHPSIIYNDKVYHSGAGVITCNNLMVGSKLWETSLNPSNSTFLFAGITIGDDKVYANSDSGELFCLYANNGKILWQIRSSGSSTALSYLNGVVYFVGGGDGKLHAVDAETGEYLWKIESPDISKNKSAIFSGLCAVVPGVGSEKGKVVVTTGLNAYCYEAIR